jgi:hypothetical protein
LSEPTGFPAQDTQKVPGLVKICVLKSPFVITELPPVAVTNKICSVISAFFAAPTSNQPFVEST